MYLATLGYAVVVGNRTTNVSAAANDWNICSRGASQPSRWHQDSRFTSVVAVLMDDFQ